MNANLFCDGVRNGQTGAAGVFSCPKNTAVVTVRGGSDVGFDKTLLAGGTPFVGELQGNGKLRYVTPLTTIATRMAVENGAFSEQRFEQAVVSLSNAMGLQQLDLDLNPVDHLDLLKANTQVHQLVSRFSTTEGDYGVVMQELADMVDAGMPLNLTSETPAVVGVLNQRLSATTPNLALTPVAEAATATELSGTNSEIQQTTSINELETVAAEVVEAPAYAFTIDHSAPLIRYSSYGRATRYYSLFDFQDDALHWNGHRATFETNWEETVEISTGAFSIDQTLTNATVSVALEFRSTSDARKLSVTLSGVKLSMVSGDRTSVVIKVPDESVINARGVNGYGVVTDVTTLAKDDQFASSENGVFRLHLVDVNRLLRTSGHPYVLSETGHYQMTVVISGVRFSVASHGALAAANEYTVSSGAETVTGHGLQGYVTRSYRYNY